MLSESQFIKPSKSFKSLNLKPKVTKKFISIKTTAKPLWPWFSFIFVACLISGFFLAIPKSQAETIDANKINFVESVDNNQFIIAQGSGIDVKVTMQLSGPSPISVVYPFSAGGGGTSVSGGIAPNPISGIYVGAVNITQNNTSCAQETTIALQKLLQCSFPYKSSTWPGNQPGISSTLASLNTWQLGQSIVFDVNLSSNDLSNLGIQSSDSGTVNQLYLYPVLSLFGITMNAAMQPAKSIYIQVFNTAAQALAAKGSAVPGAPANGPITTTPQQSSGPSLTNLLNQIVAFILSLFQQLIYGVFAWLVLPIILAVLSIHPYQDTFVAVIYSGWETIRNLCDIFFIVALIIIAMATLFRVESYKARHLLVQLIIAALLINFSLVIGQAVLAVADTAQSQFLPSNEAAVQNLGKQLMTTNNTAIMDFLKGQQSNPNASAVNNSFGGFVASVFWLAMSLGSFAVFCAIAVFLVIRIVALWLLLMISPVAYAVAVLPSTAQYREKWWKEFLKYAFFTPIMAFFLNMTALMATNATVNAQLRITAQNASIFGQSGFADLIVTLGSNILLLVFLIASLEVAKQAGIYGAEGINKIAKGGIFLPFKAAGAGGGALVGKVGQWYAKKTSANAKENEYKGNTVRSALWKGAMFLNPNVAKKAWEARSKEKEMEAYEEATGMGRDMLNRIMPTEWHMENGKIKLGQKTYYGRIGRQNMIAHKRSEWEKASLSAEEKAKAMEGAHSADEVEAIAYILADGRHEDDYMIPQNKKKVEAMRKKMYEEKKAQLKQLRSEGHPSYSGLSDADIENKAKDFSDKAQGYFDKVEYGDELLRKLMAGGASRADALERVRHLQEYYESQQKTRGLGMVVVDHDNELRSSTDLSVYEKLEKEENGHEKFIQALDGLGIFKKTADGNRAFEMIDRKTGEKLGEKTITNFASLKAAIDDTKKYDNWYDHAWKKADVGYAMSGARAWRLDAKTRHRRNSGEAWANDWEPAQNTVQTEKGYEGVNSFGERALQEKPDTHISAKSKGRNSQSRNVEEAGIFVNEKGVHDFHFDQMAVNIRTNVKATRAMIDQAKLTVDEVDKIVTKLNTGEAGDSELYKRVMDLRDDNGNLREIGFNDLVKPPELRHGAQPQP